MFLELDEYLILADKLLNANRCRYNNDEDCRTYVAHYIMKADQDYDGQTGTREGFRWQRGKFGMLNYINRERKRTCEAAKAPLGVFSLNFVYDDRVSLTDKIDDKCSDDPFEAATFNEIIDYINTLPEVQRDCVQLHYFEKRTLDSIAKDMGITRQAVYAHIKRALEQVRQKFDES